MQRTKKTRSPSTLARDAIRRRDFHNVKTLTNLEMYMALKFEYGVYDITPFDDDLTQTYNKYLADCTPIAVMLKHLQLDNGNQAPMMADVDTNFQSYVIPTTVSVSMPEENVCIGSIGPRNNEAVKPFSFVTYPPCNGGRCENCGFEVIYCSCKLQLTLSKLFLIPEEVENRDKHKFEESKVLSKNNTIKDQEASSQETREFTKDGFKILVRGLDVARRPRIYEHTTWPIVVRINKLKIQYEFYPSHWNKKYIDIGNEHFSILFGDHISQQMKHYLPTLQYLPCETVFAMMTEVPILSALYKRNIKSLKCPKSCSRYTNALCNEIKLCYSELIDTLGSMNVEQYLYTLSLTRKVEWKCVKKWKKKLLGE